jgi:predicted unusual protein kinase regulating ubiquinone biosynthesis (AarF/ABC1/UbiB family)
MGKEQERRRLRAAEFLQIFSNLGPAFIKAGQALASRPDLLPPEYLDEMQKLQDRLPPFDNEDAYRIIEEELQAPADEIFSRIEPVPVAAASIGQVYKAYLRDGKDTPVAVKVQRPNCENIISLDIYILRELSGIMSRVLTFLRRDINLVSIIDELGKLIFEEIDYLNEARNAERFRELYGSLPNVMVPTIFWKYTRRRVITMSWVDGVRLNSPYLGDAQAQKLVEIMVQCSLRQMLENGFFHADPHGGNLLATRDGKLCWLDFGMVSEVEPPQRYGIIEAVMHMVNRDFESLARLYVRLGFIPPETDLAPLVAALNRALPDVLDASVSELNFKSVINKLGSVMYKFPFRLPPYYTAIIRCLGVLEGLAIQVRRDFKIINNAYPYIASRLLTDPAPELQTALSVLLFKDGRVRWSRLESLLDSASLTSEYDFSIVANQLIEFILSPRGDIIRRHLADDLVDELDQLVLDTTRYGLQVLQGKQPTPTKSMIYFQKALSLAVANSAMARSIRGMSEEATMQSLILPYIMDGRKFLPVLQLLGTKREGQRLVMEIMTSLAERATLRGIRAVFGLEQDGVAPLQ